MVNNKIFLLEDDPDIRTIVKLILFRDGYEVTPFETIIDFGRALTSGQSADLFIMDISLPDGSGLELCKKLASDQTQSVPILIMSAGVGIEEKARECGASSSINKPFEMKNLLKKVNELLPLHLSQAVSE